MKQQEREKWLAAILSEVWTQGPTDDDEQAITDLFTLGASAWRARWAGTYQPRPLPKILAWTAKKRSRTVLPLRGLVPQGQKPLALGLDSL